jgi:predicted MFS family arabinose efflux permease
VAVYFLVFAGELPYQAIFPLLPTFVRELGLSPVEASALVAAPPIGVLAASLPVAALAERIGTRGVILGSGVGLVGTSLGQVAANDFWTLFAARIGLGAVHAGIWVAAPALLARATGGKRRVSAIAATVPVAALGAIIGPAMGGFVGERYGLHAPFVVAAAAAAAAVLACIAAPQRGRPVGRIATEPVRALESLRASPVRAAVVLTLLAALIGNVVSFLVALRLGANGLSAAAIGIVFAAAAVVLLIGSLGVAMLGSRIVSVGAGGTTALLLAASMLVVVLSRATGPVVAFMIVKSFFLAVLYTIVYPIASGMGERGAAAALGVVSAAWAAGALCGPLIAGALSGSIGDRSTYAVFLALTAVVATGTLVDRVRNRGDTPMLAGAEGG